MDKNSKSKFLLTVGLACLLLPLYSQEPRANEHARLTMDSILWKGTEYELLESLTGKWDVEQTIYKKESKEVLLKEAYVLERKMIGNFLQEIMESISKNTSNSFKRISYLSYNRIHSRWEYIVLDTRFPLMMYEESIYPEITGNSIHLYSDAFILPPFWGLEYAGLLTEQHRIIGLGGKENTNEQYWTLPGGKEFLAIKYLYKKK